MTIPTRETVVHKDTRPLSTDDLTGADLQGHTALVVDFARLPIGVLAAAGAAVQAAHGSDNLTLERTDAMFTFRRDLTYTEQQHRLAGIQATHDLGADAYDKANRGEELNAYERYILVKYLEITGLPLQDGVTV